MFIRDFPDIVFYFPRHAGFFLRSNDYSLFLCLVLSFIFSGRSVFFWSLSHAFRPKAYLGGGPHIN